MLALTTLGRPPAVGPLPRLKPQEKLLPPDFKERMYACHVLTQVLDTVAEGIEADSKYLTFLDFEKKASRFKYSTDRMVGLLFEHFDSSEATSLNNLTSVVQAALVSIIKLAVAPDYDEARVVRAHELLTELSQLAGIDAP